MRETVDRIEALIHQEVGRNIDGLFAAARGGLWHAASALAAAAEPSLGILTGFYVPLGTPPAAETDGPVGAAMLAGALTAGRRSLPSRHRRTVPRNLCRGAARHRMCRWTWCPSAVPSMTRSRCGAGSA